ncbi:MAG: hypothetical protein ACXWUP_11495 [Allosphingosinicella sp.]
MNRLKERAGKLRLTLLLVAAASTSTTFSATLAVLAVQQPAPMAARLA